MQNFVSLSNFVPVSGDVKCYEWGDGLGLAKIIGSTLPFDAPPFDASSCITEKQSSAKITGSFPADLAEIWYTHKHQLLKLLSAKKALSIQVHPTPSWASQNYGKVKSLVDRNSKPEVSFTVSNFNLFAGFDSIENLVEQFINLEQLVSVPIIERLLNDLRLMPRHDAYASALKTVAYASENYALDDINCQVDKILAALPSSDRTADLRAVRHDFPGDPSILVLMLMKHYALPPGQLVYVSPGTLHSYAHGQVVEFMLNSDNVLRAGLTPKLIDKEAFLSAVQYCESNALVSAKRKKNKTSFEVLDENWQFNIDFYNSIDEFQNVNLPLDAMLIALSTTEIKELKSESESDISAKPCSIKAKPAEVFAYQQIEQCRLDTLTCDNFADSSSEKLDCAPVEKARSFAIKGRFVLANLAISD